MRKQTLFAKLNSYSLMALLALVLLAGVACSGSSTPSGESMTTDQNPLLASWTGPHGGVPAFDRMQIEALAPALESAMAAHLQELDAIAANSESPTFDNTILEYERAGRAVDRVLVYWGIWRGNLSSSEFRQVQEAMAPKLADYRSKIIQNQPLFDRVRVVYESDQLKELTADQQRVVQLIYEKFARNGARLEGAARARYAEINQALAQAQTRFANNILADEEGYLVLLNQDQLGGLPASFVAATAAAATDRGHDGQYAIANTRSSMAPFLTFSDERELREQVWRNYYSRGDNGGEHDNNALIAEILALRHERVQLLGYENYAAWRLEDRMAKTPEQAFELLESVWPAALARVREEVADMQAIADAEGAGWRIEPWDYRYYAEKVRQAKYAYDSNEVKQYLQLNKLREGMFLVAREIFDLDFAPLTDGSVPVFHEDVTVWKVTRASSGEPVGLWYLDPYARGGKRSGAWASTYRGHETFDGVIRVLVSNNSNFIKGAPGEPVLISWDDAGTLFHEFGHALHALTSAVDYPTLNSGVRDYTEFQSQLLERWLLTDRIIEQFLVHHKTGEPMPEALVTKLKNASTFNQGFETTEFLASALLDMMYHTTDPAGLDADAFEKQALEKLNMPREIVMRHRSPHFGHIFSSEGYSAGYYGYFWAEVLTADAGEAFENAPGGYFDKALAENLVRHTFAARNAVDPAEAYRRFRGRDAQRDALLRDRGF